MAEMNSFRINQFEELPTLRVVRHSTHVTRRAAQALGGLIVASVALLTVVPWQQNVTGQGRVIAYAPLERQQPLEAPLAGRIVRWGVEEGTRVKKGDLIAVISDNDPFFVERMREQREALQARLDAASRQLEAQESRVDALRASREANLTAADSRIRMVQERVRGNEQALSAAEATLETARLNLQRQESLAAEGLSSTRTLELARLEHAKALAGLESARATLTSSRNELQAVQSERRKLETDANALISDGQAKAEYARADVAKERIELAKLEVAMARQSTQEVRAPRDGTILRLIAREGGEVVKTGDALAVLVPDTTSHAVELYVDGNDAPLISEGRHVRLQFEGWPALQFSGWPAVAVGTFGGRVALVDAADDGKGRFRIVVVPDGEEPWPSARFLRQGVRANGWVLLEQVKLGYELWRQFNGFPPVVARSEPDWFSADPGGKKSEGDDGADKEESK
ncbi:MAG TPA: HlyD family efflux transporter periplasmic adaptor subunit [Myxococcaceae bacterium]|nr:HlyD family efflux transporter periplasmic adaptor subunit [Myxococcaceae bacterium]